MAVLGRTKAAPLSIGDGGAVRWGYVLRQVALGGLVVVVAIMVTWPLRHWPRLGGDYQLYMDATRSWLGGGPFYHPWQLEPYAISFTAGELGATSILYPPYALALFVPFTFLPPVLWWAVPLTLIAYGLRDVSGWRLVALLVAMVLPASLSVVANGNPAMWSAAFLVMAARWPWAGVFVLLKPTLAPFAVRGIRSRGWWVGLAGIGVLSLALWPLTLEYVEVIGNATGPYASPLYSLATFVPLALLWFASSTWRRSGSRTPVQLAGFQASRSSSTSSDRTAFR